MRVTSDHIGEANADRPREPAGWSARSAWTTCIALVGITLFAAAFRLWDLGRPSLWLDELYSVAIAAMPQQQLWSNWMVRETNPPLYYSLLHAWMGAFGTQEFAVRAFSVACGVASVPVTYLIGRRLHSRQAGLIAALLTAVSGVHLQYSQQARGYALGLLAAAVAIYALLRLTERWLNASPSRRGAAFDLSLYAGATSVAFYTHTTFFLLPVLANLYVGWLWRYRLERRWTALSGWVLANVATLIACSWWIWITLQQVTNEGGADAISWITRPSVRKALSIVRDLFGTRELRVGDSLVAVVLAGLALWGLRRMTAERRALMVIFCAGVPLGLFLVSFKQPVYLERTLLWALAAYIPLVAVGVATLPPRRLVLPVTIAVVGVWLLDAAMWRHRYYREPWRDIAAVVSARAGPNDALMVGGVSTLVAFRYYCTTRCADLRHISPRSPPGDVLREGFRGIEVGPANVRQALQGIDRVWVIHRRTGRQLEQLLAGSAVQENSDVLASDPLVRAPPARRGRLRLSSWRVAPTSSPVPTK